MLGTFVSFLCEILALHLPCTSSSCRLEEAHQSLKTASKPCETDKERYLERSLDSTSKASIEGEGADSKEIQGKTSTDSRGSGSESPSNSSVSRQKAAQSVCTLFSSLAVRPAGSRTSWILATAVIARPGFRRLFQVIKHLTLNFISFQGVRAWQCYDFSTWSTSYGKGFSLSRNINIYSHIHYNYYGEIQHGCRNLSHCEGLRDQQTGRVQRRS